MQEERERGRKPRCHVYARHSTEDQAKGSSHARQLEAAEGWAAAHGYELASQELYDRGVSAWKGDNVAVGKLGAFLQSIRDGLVQPGDVLLVESLDRISRQKARRAARILEDICDAGVDVVTLHNGHRYTAESLDELGFIYVVLEFVQAAQYSDRLSERVTAGWKHKRKRLSEGAEVRHGVLHSRGPWWLEPYSNGTWKVVDAHAQVVRDIFRRYVEGDGLNKIARDLNEAGIQPLRRPGTTQGEGKRGIGVQGRVWHHTSVRKVLTNRAVVGVLALEDVQDLEGYYPTILSRDLFDRAQVMLKRASGGTQARDGKIKNLFAMGVGRCGFCGGVLVRNQKNRATYKGPINGGSVYLQCQDGRLDPERCPGRGPHVRLDRIERSFLENAHRLLSEVPLEEASHPTEAHRTDAEIRVTESEIEHHVDSLERLQQQIEDHGPSAAVASRMKHLESEVKAAQKRLRKLYERLPRLHGSYILARVRELHAALDALDVDHGDRKQANLVIQQLYESVFVDFEREVLVLVYVTGFEQELPYSAKGFGF